VGVDRRAICKASAWVQREPRALKFEHDAVLAFDIIVRRKAEAVAIESERSCEISHSQCDHADLRLERRAVFTLGLVLF
jgi:hypothetical protein